MEDASSPTEAVARRVALAARRHVSIRACKVLNACLELAERGKYEGDSSGTIRIQLREEPGSNFDGALVRKISEVRGVTARREVNDLGCFLWVTFNTQQLVEANA